MAITENDWRLVNQHVVDVMIELIVQDDNGQVIDQLYGIVNGGSINIDSGSSVRRTASFSITPTKQITNISEKSLIWLNKNVTIHLGILDQRTKQRTWYNQGVYLYNSANSSFDANNNIMNIELSDWVLKLDGTVNGQVGGAITTILPAYEEDPVTGEPLSYNSIKKALEDTLKSAGLTTSQFEVADIGEYYAMPEHNPDYQAYRNKYPLWNMIPYDLEFSAGCSVWDIISELVQLYPNYDAAYNVNGKFIVHMIPSEFTDENDFYYEDYQQMLISEQISTELTGVKNICEVWGESMDTDWYTDGVGHGKTSVYNLTTKMSGQYYHIDGILTISGKQVGTLDQQLYQNLTTDVDFQELHILCQSGTLYIIANRNNMVYNGTTYSAGQTIFSCAYGAIINITISRTSDSSNFVVPLEGYPNKYRTGDRIAVQFTQPSYTGQLMQINCLDALPIVDQSSKEEIGESELDTEHIHVFYIAKVKTENNEYVNQFFYLGVSQSHGIDVLTDGTVVPNGYYDMNEGRYYDLYSQAYYMHVLNCDNVSLTVCPDSPFTVQKLGNRIDVKADGEFSNITSNELALERAQYENWKNSRLTDNITITTKLMPFVEPYMKIDYKKNGYNVRNDYIVQSVSHDLDNGTTTIQMYTFYSLYKRQPGDLDRMTYKYMGGFMNEDLYGNQDLT